MIVLRSWLNEFIDISDISSEDICKTLNSIGLEVDSLNSVKIPSGVVVGKVLECEKHPDADKLNICQVDLGSRVEQIVCGAKNVAKDQYVAVATVGADLGEGFVIKEAKLRGVNSNGMICSSSEIGLGKTNDGIMVLDESIGELKLAKELCEYEVLNDDIIEIELTANRGDALSIYGVARDLSAALNRDLKDFQNGISVQKKESISKDDLPLHLAYYKIEEELKSSTLVDIRLGLVDKFKESGLKNIIAYLTHATGVLFRSYPKIANNIAIREKNGLGVVYFDDSEVSIVGVNQTLDGVADKNLIEASYIDPHFISKAMMDKDIKTDELFYNSSRGSESSLELGFSYLCKILNKSDISILSTKMEDNYKKNINLSIDWLEKFIGQKIDKKRVVDILTKLRFLVEDSGDSLDIRVPLFRSDIENRADLAEEFVRMIGIDNLKSTPMNIIQRDIFNKSYFDYKKRNFYRVRATGAGFSEAIHYFFDSSKLLEEFSLESIDKSLDLINPINSELDTLRTTLVLHLIRSASLNIKNSKRSVKLFEIGRVVDKNRDEHNRFAFIFSGDKEEAYISNLAKAKSIDLLSFANSVSHVIGDFELKKMEDDIKILNPYESADIYILGKKVGYMGELHIDLKDRFDLPKSYICELEFDKLEFDTILAKPYSKFPSLNRDISILKPKELEFSTINKSIKRLGIDEIIKVYPIDLYRSDELQDKESLTIRLVIQSDTKTLNESEINGIMSKIVEELKSDLGLELR